MTREEAIKNLLEMRDGMPFDKCQDWIETVSMAIKSLEAWKKVEEDLNGDFTRQTKGFRYGIDYAIATIDKHFEKVER